MPPEVSIPGGAAVSAITSAGPFQTDPSAVAGPLPGAQELKRTPMANTSSAKKAARQMIRRTDVNKARRSSVKTDVRSVEEAIASGDRTKAEAALKAAQPVLARSAQKGMMHKKTASRKVSRLTKRVKAMSA